MRLHINLIDKMLDLLIREIKDESIKEYLFEIRDSYNQLESVMQKVDECDIAYFIESQPLVDDATYDAIKIDMFNLIARIKNQSKVVENFSLSDNDNQSIKRVFSEIRKIIRRRESKVGAKPSRQFKKIRHKRPMLSLSNCFSVDDVRNFMKRINDEKKIVCELKIDGVSFSAIYENGQLKMALTRGDGQIGEDITLNVKQICNIPLEIEYRDTLEIHGEIYIDKETFSRMNGFSNPRNAASGSIRQLDPIITRERHLKYFVWNANFEGINSHYKQISMAKEFGFSTNSHILLVESFSGMMKFYEEISLIRSSLNYDIDGIVYKVDDIALQENFGYTASSPRWATAYKFPAVEAITAIKDIIIQIGKSGILTPVAVLEPINIGGAIISRATLHNSCELKKHGYSIGDLVRVVRAGDVIPKINGIVKKNATNDIFVFPVSCSVCNSRVIDDETFTHKICIGGWSCKGQLIERLKHFVSRGAFNIIGLGEKQIEYFVNNSIISSYSDIFMLEERNTTYLLQNQHGWGDKSVSELFKSINSARAIEFHKFIYSLSIPHVGVEIATLLAKNFRSYERLIDAIGCTTVYEKLTEINGIGDQIAKSVIQFFRDEYNLKLLKSLLLQIEILSCKENNVGDTYAFTGTLSSITRPQAVNLIEKNRQSFSSSVIKKVKYLVVGDNPSKTKIDRAKTLNIQFLSESEFMKLMNIT